jgi:APA family basic amino acid/polyamine antiporter
VLLSTLGCVIGYLFCAMADIVLARRSANAVPWRNLALACGGFAFSLLAVIGAGAEAVYWNFILLVAGIPLYVLLARRGKGDATTEPVA